jgi:hypothetical protein
MMWAGLDLMRLPMVWVFAVAVVVGVVVVVGMVPCAMVWYLYSPSEMRADVVDYLVLVILAVVELQLVGRIFVLCLIMLALGVPSFV